MGPRLSPTSLANRKTGGGLRDICDAGDNGDVGLVSLTGRRHRLLVIILALIGFWQLLADKTKVAPIENFQATPIERTTFGMKTKSKSKNNILARETCIEKRGSSGYWFRDEDFGRKTFYALEYRSNKWYRKNKKNSSAIYKGNVFNWRDTSLLLPTSTMAEEESTQKSTTNNNHTTDVNHELQNDCQIKAVDRTLFCDTMVKLKIGRILMVGDSLMGTQMDSLLTLVNFNVGSGWRRNRDHAIKHCGILHNTVQVSFRRENVGANLLANDPLGYLENGYTKDDRENFGPENPFCNGNEETDMGPDDYCPWQLDYNTTSPQLYENNTDSKRTLLLLNQGAHFHSTQTFKNSFDNFVDKFNTIARPDDIVVFRSTVPGHKDCYSEFEGSMAIEEMTHDKFLERFGTDKYDWNLFDEYNRYARDVMVTNLTNTVRSLYLNVYNMTVLRPDEHISKTDCLHYAHPGPIDFWNHLLISNLADLAKNDEEREHELPKLDR